MSEPIILTEKQRIALEQIAKRSRQPKRITQRAQIILQSDEGASLQQIAENLQLCVATVSVWRRRWRSMRAVLNRAQRARTQRSMVRAIEKVLDHTGREIRNIELSDNQKDQILALRRQDPKEYGYRHWTMKLLADESIKAGIVEEISAQKVGVLIRGKG